MDCNCVDALCRCPFKGRLKVLITVLENIGFMEPSGIPVSQCTTVVPDIDSGRGCACWESGGVGLWELCTFCSVLL